MPLDSNPPLTSPVTTAKIIPLYRDAWLQSGIYRQLLNPSERGRHFLKVTLPAIPITVFTLTFLLVYFVDGIDAMQMRHSINPMPALIGASGMAIIVGTLCTAIYSGFRHVAGLIDEDQDS